MSKRTALLQMNVSSPLRLIQAFAPAEVASNLLIDKDE
jgi:hypothetical protein